MLAGIADDEHDNGIFIQIARYSQRRRQIRSARASTKNAFGPTQLPGHFKGFPIRNVDYFIHIFHVRVGRHNFLPDTFDEIGRSFNNLSRIFVGLKNRAIRIGANHSDVRILLF